MNQDKQQLINALLSYYQNKAVFLSDKKVQLLKKLVKQSDELKIDELNKKIEKSKL